MDYTQLWIVIPFIGIGWFGAVAAKRSSFKRSGDAHAAHKIYLSVWGLFSLFGIFVFLYRAF